MNKLDRAIKKAQSEYAKLMVKLKSLEIIIYNLTKKRYGR